MTGTTRILVCSIVAVLVVGGEVAAHESVESFSFGRREDEKDYEIFKMLYAKMLVPDGMTVGKLRKLFQELDENDLWPRSLSTPPTLDESIVTREHLTNEDHTLDPSELEHARNAVRLCLPVLDKVQTHFWNAFFPESVKDRFQLVNEAFTVKHEFETTEYPAVKNDSEAKLWVLQLLETLAHDKVRDTLSKGQDLNLTLTHKINLGDLSSWYSKVVQYIKDNVRSIPPDAFTGPPNSNRRGFRHVILEVLGPELMNSFKKKSSTISGGATPAAVPEAELLTRLLNPNRLIPDTITKGEFSELFLAIRHQISDNESVHVFLASQEKISEFAELDLQGDELDPLTIDQLAEGRVLVEYCATNHKREISQILADKMFDDEGRDMTDYFTRQAFVIEKEFIVKEVFKTTEEVVTTGLEMR
eukprot:GHVU01137909.1.p1 GENE.GHVU01137909.1~~GHVU01137909.1.p1  ORF type:complete len:417 (-),score=47.90 GHVU01137909.1:322-1572(-)